MVTMAQSAANWRNTDTQENRTHSLTHLHQHSYNHFVGNASTAITEFGIEFLFWRYLKEGGKPEYPDKPPADRYHILEEKNQCLGRESNPHPPALVISSLDQERAPIESDPLSYRPPQIDRSWYTWCFIPSQPRRIISGLNKTKLPPQVKFLFT